MQVKQLWVQRDQLREMKVVEHEAAPLEDGEIRVTIEKFGLTANNVSYAVSGDVIGYWKYFPAEGTWGVVPVWGFAQVIESRCAGIPKGERLWGFFPMATHTTLQPASIADTQFFDGRAHRRELPSLYNLYMRTGNDPAALQAMEDERCVLFPLFATSFILYDYLIAHDFFGAEQVVIGSASSKTGFGLAHLLFNDAKLNKQVIGLTSAGNVSFVEKLGVCHQVVGYEDIATLNASKPTAFVDMAGSGKLIEAVHQHFGEQTKESCIVGATHWESERKAHAVPGAKPRFFFAPSHIAARDKEWGQGQVLVRAFTAGIQIAQSLQSHIGIESRRGAKAAADSLLALLNNEVSPRQGLMLSMHD